MRNLKQKSAGAGCAIETLEGRAFLSATGVATTTTASTPHVGALFPLFPPSNGGSTTPPNNTPTPRDDDSWLGAIDEDLDNDGIANDNDSDDDADGISDSEDPDDDNDGLQDDLDSDDDHNGVVDPDEPIDYDDWYDGDTDGSDLVYVEAKVLGRSVVRSGKAFKFKVVYTSDEAISPSELIGVTVHKEDATPVDASVMKFKESKDGLKLTVSYKFSSPTGGRFQVTDNGLHELAAAVSDKEVDVLPFYTDEPIYTADGQCVIGSFLIAARLPRSL